MGQSGDQSKVLSSVMHSRRSVFNVDSPVCLESDRFETCRHCKGSEYFSSHVVQLARG